MAARGPEGFPRRVRLTDPKRYQEVFKSGKRVRHASVGIIAAPNGLTYARLGLAVSRKVSRRAVMRNTIKRRIREFFRHQQGRLPALDFVVIAYPDAATAASGEFAATLLRLLQKISPLCASS